MDFWKRISLTAAGFLIAACATPTPVPQGQSAEFSATDTDAVQIMVLGTYHFAGSETDLISVERDSVLTPRRQSELDDIADALMAFDATHVVVERVTEGPGYIDPYYKDFGPQALKKTENERVQLGYRIASRLELETVHGIDEQPSEGEPDYFPFGQLVEHAGKTGQSEELDAIVKGVSEFVESHADVGEDASIAERLLAENVGPLADANPGFYFGLSKFDVAEDQPAAELQAYWYMRNAKIFSKIIDVTAPGDRVIVLYGAGHKYWLETIAEGTPGYTPVDPVPYLRAAAARSGER